MRHIRSGPEAIRTQTRQMRSVVGALVWYLLGEAFVAAMLISGSGIYDLTTGVFVSILSCLPLLFLLRDVRFVESRGFIALVQGIPIGLQCLMLLNGLLRLVFLRPDALIPGQPFQPVRAWLIGLLVLEACKLLLLIWNLGQGLRAQQPDSASLGAD